VLSIRLLRLVSLPASLPVTPTGTNALVLVLSLLLAPAPALLLPRAVTLLPCSSCCFTSWPKPSNAAADASAPKV
jgi:hypothetical protein